MSAKGQNPQNKGKKRKVLTLRHPREEEGEGPAGQSPPGACNTQSRESPPTGGPLDETDQIPVSENFMHAFIFLSGALLGDDSDLSRW